MKQSLYYLLLGAFLTCCTPMDQIEPLAYSVLGWEEGSFSNISRFQTSDHGVFDLNNIAEYLFFFDKTVTFRVAALEYATVDPHGNPVMASGVVFHPLNRKSKGVITVLPTARIGGNGPSDELFAIEGITALHGYTVMLPDLLGFGVSKDLRSPFLMAENTGRVTYDMRRAAAQYLWDQFRYTLPAETIIMGYSLGGSAALATQKYFETHHGHSVKVKEVFAGGGAYDLPTAFSIFSQTGFSDYPSIPNTILAFNHYYRLNLDFEQVFTGALLHHYNDWYSGNYSVDEIMEFLGSNLHDFMHEDFFNPFGSQNQEFEKLYPHLLENSVSEGWHPKGPIYLSHSKTDTYVPIECAEEAVRKLRKAGANISLITYPGGHYTVGYLHFLRSVIRYL